MHHKALGNVVVITDSLKIETQRVVVSGKTTQQLLVFRMKETVIRTNFSTMQCICTQHYS